MIVHCARARLANCSDTRRAADTLSCSSEQRQSSVLPGSSGLKWLTWPHYWECIKNGSWVNFNHLQTVNISLPFNFRPIHCLHPRIRTTSVEIHCTRDTNTAMTLMLGLSYVLHPAAAAATTTTTTTSKPLSSRSSEASHERQNLMTIHKLNITVCQHAVTGNYMCNLLSLHMHT